MLFYILFLIHSKSSNNPKTLKKIQQDVLKYTNIYREKNGKSPLKLHESLNKAAEIQADSMVHIDKVGHEGHTKDIKYLNNRLGIVNFDFKSAAENCALRFDEDCKGVVDQWINSPLHRTNLISNNEYMGISMKVGKNNNHYFCQVFGTEISQNGSVNLIDNNKHTNEIVNENKKERKFLKITILLV